MFLTNNNGLNNRVDRMAVMPENEINYERNTLRWAQWDTHELKTLLNEFSTSYLKREGKSPTTIQKYHKDLLQFFTAKGLTRVSHIDREIINRWVLDMRNRNLTTGSIANHLWAIKAFLKFLKVDKRIACYEFDVKIPTVKPPETIEYLELDELENQFYSVIDIAKPCGLRLRTLIEVMVSTGLRPSEALRLKRNDFENNPDEIEIVGKGNKKRAAYFTERALFWIKGYMKVRTDTVPELFITHNGSGRPRPFSLRHAEDRFQERFKRSGINKRVTLHTLRHTYGTLMLANGCPADLIALNLGHSKVETTRKYYLAIRHKYAKAAHFRFNPFSSVNGNGLVADPSRHLLPLGA